jgi:deoxyribose-phosphate aldolase
MVISREAFLAGDDARVMEEIVRVKDVCGDAHLKVIIETAELGSYDHVRHASMLAMEAGADFIKTSTGKAASGRHARRRARDARGDPRLRGPHRPSGRA